ncbi:MAG: AAA family ATPase [Salinivirgaceae bacterium]|jgi:exodeoxyribonuclease-5|nr:AAA family ATPase [Salinivirgaceae bacterium]
MVKNHIKEILINKLEHEPTDDQKLLIDQLSDFILGITDAMDNQDKVFIVKGYAGTGKTTVISALVKSLPALRLKSVLLAPTGRAAKVLSVYSGKPASTIHKKIYRQKTQKDAVGEFSLDKNLHKNTLFIVDESSMISNASFENSVFGSGRVLDDLMQYVYSGANCRLILVGDTAQLPPVGLTVSPALDKHVVDSMGFEVFENELTQVVRQHKQSGVLYNATLLRERISDLKVGYPKFELEGFNDLIKLSGADLIEELDNCYNKYGVKNNLVICRSNKRANRYNEGIRRSILWYEEELSIGDLLMVVKNNYFWLTEEDKETTEFIANGDIVEVTRIGKYKELYGFRFAEVSVRFMDYPDLEIDTNILLDTLTSETASLSQEQNKQFFYSVMEDYANLRTKKAKIKAVKENPFFNALQVKFSYAITCHKAQGGQWKTVFVDQGWLNDDMVNIEYLRWLYTALTRPVEKLYLVNFKDEFFN